MSTETAPADVHKAALQAEQIEPRLGDLLDGLLPGECGCGEFNGRAIVDATARAMVAAGWDGPAALASREAEVRRQIAAEVRALTDDTEAARPFLARYGLDVGAGPYSTVHAVAAEIERGES